jgi:hypothetical protein
MSANLTTSVAKKIVSGVIGVALLVGLTAGGAVPALAAVATGGEERPDIRSTGFDCIGFSICFCDGWQDCLNLRLEHPDCTDWIFQGSSATCVFIDDIIFPEPSQGAGSDDGDPVGPLDGVTRPSDTGPAAPPVDPNVSDGDDADQGDPPSMTVPAGSDPGDEPTEPTEPGEGDEPDPGTPTPPSEPSPPVDPRPSGPASKQLPLPNLPGIAY